MVEKERKYVTLPQQNVPVFAEFDVAVVGAGPAGLCAALAAARSGARTVLVEKDEFLGGQFTSPHSNYAGTGGLGMSFQSFSGRQIVAGIGWEIMTRLQKEGAANGKVPRYIHFYKGDYLYYPHHLMGPRATNGDAIKTLAFEMCEEEGVDVLLFSNVVDVLKDGDTVTGVIIQSKSGRHAVKAKVVVDASADADVAYYSGAEYEQMPSNELWYMVYLLRVAGVNGEEVREYVRNNLDKFAIIWGEKDPDGNPVHFSALSKEGANYEISESGTLLKADGMRSTISDGRGGHVSIWGEYSGDCTDVKDLTQAVIVGRRKALKKLSWLKENIPGYQNAYVVTADKLGFRESRRIKGEYQVSEQDILEGRQFKDSIGLNNMPLDMHLPQGGWEYRVVQKPHQIPFRCIVPQKVQNLLVAGRCISSTHLAQASLRKVTACFVTGQASGTAAAICAKGNILPRNIDINDLQETLKGQGCILEEGDAQDW